MTDYIAFKKKIPTYQSLLDYSYSVSLLLNKLVPDNKEFFEDNMADALLEGILLENNKKIACIVETMEFADRYLANHFEETNSLSDLPY